MTTSQTFWCIRHNRVEPDDGPLCPVQYRLGPFADRAAAEKALDTVQQRNEAWDAEDARWDND
jgi:hypothetical protein